MTKTYPITQAQYDAFLKSAKDAGAKFEDHNLVTLRGVTLQYNYADGAATLTILHKSFPISLMPDAEIFTRIEQAAGL